MSYKKVKISDIGKIVSGATPKTKDVDNYGGSIAWITPADLSGYTSKYISHGSRNITQKGYDSCSTHLMPRGTVLFSSRAPIGYVAIAENPICTNQGFKSIVPNDDIDSEFLYYQLQYLRKKIQEKGSGTTFKEISGKVLGETDIVVPSLEEQSRIVSRIDELFSELDKAVGTLKTTKEQLEVYRQAVLVDIFSQEHPLRQLKEISVALSGFAFKSKNYTPDGKYTVIKIGNVKDGYWDFSRDKTRTNEVTDRILQKYLLKQGDCLITLTGTRGKRDYGFVSMIERQTDYLLNQRVAALRFDTMIALPEFFRYYLSSLNYRNQFFKYETGNVGQGNVGIKALCEPAVPCPPLDTQKKIVDQISDRLSVCDSIEKTVDTALAQADAMRQSILKQAFDGKI